jgi:hypothetical protein
VAGGCAVGKGLEVRALSSQGCSRAWYTLGASEYEMVHQQGL